MIRRRQENIEVKRVRRCIVKRKQVSALDIEVSVDSYGYFNGTVPEKGEDERKTRSLMGVDSFERLRKLKLEDLRLKKEKIEE